MPRLTDQDVPMSPCGGRYQSIDLGLFFDNFDNSAPDFDFSSLDIDTAGASIDASGFGSQEFESGDEAPTMQPQAREEAIGLNAVDLPPSGILPNNVEARGEESTVTFDGSSPISAQDNDSRTTLAHGLNGKSELPAAKLEDIAEYIRDIRSKLDLIEASLRPSGPPSSGEEQQKSVSRPTKGPRSPKERRQHKAQKRRKAGSEVTLKASKVLVDNRVYFWQQPRGGSGHWCTKGDTDVFDGCELLLLGENITVELRPNLDWLPISVRWNQSKRIFEGFDQLDEHKKLVVSEAVITDLVCDPMYGRGSGHVEFVRGT